jgi:hypothetical protein
MKAVDHVDLRERLVCASAQLGPHLFEGHRVRTGVARLEARKRAEQAAGDADVRRLDADVVVVVGAPSVALLALAIRQPADGEQVGLKQAHAVREIQTDASREFFVDVGEAGGGDAGRRHLVIG